MKVLVFQCEGKEYNIRIGTNKQDNWDLLDTSVKTDIWFHVNGGPSAYVILQNDQPIKNIPRQVIKRCACLCKSNSSSKSIKKCDIIYTFVENVRKTDIVGQVETTNIKTIII